MRHKPITGGRTAARFFHRNRGFLRKCTALFLCILLLPCWLGIDRRLRPAAQRACLYECRAMTAQAVAQSISDSLEMLEDMELSLSFVSYDGEGNITGIQANSDAVNTVQTLLLAQLNAALAAQRDAEYSVHLGTLTGLYTLTGRGVELPLRYVPMGNAQVQLQSDFSSAGINQTIHTLTAEITVHAGCAVPLYQADVTQQYTYLLAETVIIGDVPSVQWNTQNPAG